MNTIFKTALGVVGAAIAMQAAAQATFYEREGFHGRSFTTQRQIGDFGRYGFNDRASSVEVVGNRWEVCEDVRFRGRCVVLRPGRYLSLAAMGLNDRISSVRTVGPKARIRNERYAPAPEVAQATFYEHQDFRGRTFSTTKPVRNFARYGFNDRASSVEVVGERWEVCENVRFRGRCMVLRPGRYPSLAAMGLNDRVSSVRALGANERIRDERFAPAPQAEAGTERHDYRRRHDERLFQADVTSVHAVVGPPAQRCWVEHQQVTPERGSANVPGAIAGAVIGGILGHQVGNGRGQDLATVGGAVAGAAVGANVGRNGGQPAQTQDVKRCESVPNQARPEYWDVTYNFRGEGHRIQTTAAPGATVTVNAQGEPRE
jgi:uncharacterized protein YcfJ